MSTKQGALKQICWQSLLKLSCLLSHVRIQEVYRLHKTKLWSEHPTRTDTKNYRYLSFWLETMQPSHASPNTAISSLLCLPVAEPVDIRLLTNRSQSDCSVAWETWSARSVVHKICQAELWSPPAAPCIEAYAIDHSFSVRLCWAAGSELMPDLAGWL